MMKLQLSQELNEFVSSMNFPVLSIPFTSPSLALWFIPLGIKVSPASKVISTRNAPIFRDWRIQDTGVKTEHRRPPLRPLELFEHHTAAQLAWKGVSMITLVDSQMIGFYCLHC